MKKIFYFDVESTGFNKIKNDIVQLSGIIEVDGEVKEKFNFRCQPFDFENVEQGALDITGLTIKDLKGYEKPQEIYKKLIKMLGRYVNKFDRDDKFYPAGYNVNFDVDFLSEFFKKNGDVYYGSWFNWRLIDGLPMVHFLDYAGKINLSDHKLGTVCKHFGIDIKAHDAMSDIEATRNLLVKIRKELQ